jgi:OPT family small oligopeptide transporter
LFILRYPPISIGPYVVQLIAYPIGLGFARVLPNKEFKIFGRTANLNPGPFNVKEHVIIVAMANAAFGGGSGYFLDTVVSLSKFYHFDTSQFGWGFNILFALSTQCLGFGLAGSVRKFLVEPAAMIWPGALVNVGFMYALHDHSRADPSTTNGWGMSRFKWFMICMTGMFIWSWFPDFIFPALSYFAWVTWVKPENVIVNQLFGQSTGISLGFPFTGFTLDWAQINSFYNSPLISPWFALANTGVGIVFFGWIIVPALHYGGVWYAEYVPISQNGILDNTGSTYNTSRILTAAHVVDPAAYEAYSPLFLSTAFALTYGMSFATIAALVSHTYLFHGPEIWRRYKSSKGELDDIHMKIMRKYKLVPTYWYLILLGIMVAFAFASALAFPTEMAWYSVILSLVIASVFTIPIGMIQAFTNIQVRLANLIKMVMNILTRFYSSVLTSLPSSLSVTFSPDTPSP